MTKQTGEYPDDWPEIAKRKKDEVCWLCERCAHPHDAASGYCLTVHHLDGNKSNCADWNLACLCQRCHLRIQGRVNMAQGWLFEHTEWMKKHVEGYEQAQRR